MQKIWVLALVGLLVTGIALRASPRTTPRRLTLEILFGVLLVVNVVSSVIYIYLFIAFRLIEGSSHTECTYNLASDILIQKGRYHALSWNADCEAAPGGMFSEVTTTSEVYISDTQPSEIFRRTPPRGLLLIRSLGPIKIAWSGGRLHVETPKRDVVENRTPIEGIIVDYHFT